MATVLTNLDRSGLIERSLSPLHQKVTVNSISDEGRALVARADKAPCAWRAGSRRSSRKRN